MGKIVLVRVHTPTETIDIPGDQLIGFDMSRPYPAVAWREPGAGEVVKLLGGALEIHEQEGGIEIPTLHVVQNPGGPR